MLRSMPPAQVCPIQLGALSWTAPARGKEDLALRRASVHPRAQHCCGCQASERPRKPWKGP
eukprot:4447770-Amphidinium_carterae.1